MYPVFRWEIRKNTLNSRKPHTKPNFPSCWIKRCYFEFYFPSTRFYFSLFFCKSGADALTSSRIWSSRPMITGSTCSTDNIHAESCRCSKLTILDCSSEVRTKTTMQTPRHRTDTAMQTVTAHKSLQSLHCLDEPCCCFFPCVLLMSSPALPAAPHFWSSILTVQLSFSLNENPRIFQPLHAEDPSPTTCSSGASERLVREKFDRCLFRLQSVSSSPAPWWAPISKS